jgi:hypothetical protein
MVVEMLVRRVIDGEVKLSVEMVDASWPLQKGGLRAGELNLICTGRRANNKRDTPKNRGVNNSLLQSHR